MFNLSLIQEFTLVRSLTVVKYYLEPYLLLLYTYNLCVKSCIRF